MVGSLWTGISGLSGQQTALDNESHNIANVNTIGYKASRISFADQIYQNKIGKGVQILDAEKLYTQGNLKRTGVNFDMALSDDGFFAVSASEGGGTSETYYTRAGNFRMGDNGTLQDALGNEVQGWAVSSEQVVDSSNPNASSFTNDYTKLLSSKIIQYSSSVETITAKSTDYTLTAKGDDSAVFSGSGLKTKSGKVADVEELVKAYTAAVQSLKNDPNASSATSSTQSSHITLPAQSIAADAISADGDEVYVYINGDKISQSYISGTARTGITATEDGYIKTMKAFADKISEIPGIKAYVAKENGAEFTPDTHDAEVLKGILRIESIVPGDSFNITSTGMVHAGNDKPGLLGTEVTGILGTGVGAVESAKLALNEAITGKQYDVYTREKELEQVGSTAGTDFTYSVTIYDKGQNKNIILPTLSIANPANIDAMVADFNNPDLGGAGNNKLPEYLKAFNINGNLVIKTLDSNFDVEFSGSLKGPDAEVHTVAITGAATGPVTFLGKVVAGSVNGDTDAQTLTKILADKTAIIAAWNISNADKELEDITGTGTTLTLTFKTTEGDITPFTEPASAGITFGISTETVAFNATQTADVKRNVDYSGREGAGAEFIELTTRIDQSASKSSLQLRLDSLGISDSAFGDFSVNESGLITMSQDGAEFAVGQVAIAKFITNRGLEPMGDNLLKATLASGDAIFNLNNDKTADIKSSTLELSTADLSESLVNLMVFQRAFEANAKSITTADTILNTLIQLKR